MTKKLENKSVLVTGGSRGIGAGIVKRLAQEGANIALTYSSSPEQAQDVVAQAEAFGVKALAIKADSSQAEELVAAVDAAAKALGGLDILVNNAGVGVMAPVDEIRLEDFDRILAINVRAVFIATQAAVKHMGEGGRIINISSANAKRIPFAGGCAYAMSKSALSGLVQGLSRDLGPRGITINNILPGPIDTEMNPADGEHADFQRSLNAIPRFGEVAEVAAMAAYLAGPESGFVTGADLSIDGGMTA